MKKTVVILSLLALVAGSCAKQTANSDETVYTDELIPEKIVGDLNSDGEEDFVTITKQTKKELASVKNTFDEEVDRNRRGILIAFKTGEEYNTVLKIPDCFSSENEEGGVYYPPQLSIEIKKGNLRIHYNHGRYGWWQYTFRYRNGNFELIGYDESNNRGPVIESMVSINYLTKKKKTQTNTNPDADYQEEVFEESWEDVELPNGLVKLIDIRDFDEFMIR